MKSKELAEETGWVAFTSSRRRTKLHLLFTPLGRTLCGRYRFEQHTGTEPVSDNTPTCQVCARAAS